jgi:hypothetical protein
MSLLPAILFASAAIAGAPLPSGALAKAEPIEHYRELFAAAQPPSIALHRELVGRKFQCEVATFQPITYDEQKGVLAYYGIKGQEKKFVYPGIDLEVTALEEGFLEYRYLGGEMRYVSQYRDVQSSRLSKDSFGQFVNVTRSPVYPFEKGSVLFFVELRVNAAGDLLFESSYLIPGYPLPNDWKPPVSPGGRDTSERMYVDDYVSCKAIRPKPLNPGDRPPPSHRKEEVFDEYMDYLQHKRR